MATSYHSSRSTTPRLPQIQPEFSSPGSDYMTYIYNVHASNIISSPTVSNRSGKSQSLDFGGNSSQINHQSGKENKIGAQFPDFYFLGSDTQSKKSKKSLSDMTSSTRKNSDMADFKEIGVDQQLGIGSTHQRFSSPTLITDSNQQIPLHSLQPPVTSAKSSIRTAKSDKTTTGSPFKLSFIASPKLDFEQEAAPIKQKSWNPPLLSEDEYQSMKERLLKKGKFKNHLMKYFRLEKPEWARHDECDDEQYNERLETQLGFELIADESAREILADGMHHDYMKSCRRCRRNPNTYFLRHCFDDELCMRYRCLSKGDSRSIGFQIKSDMAMSKIDFSDNGIQDKGMKHLSTILVENKMLTELILARNNLEAIGVKHLKHCLVSNCFLLKLDISDNAFGEKGCKYIAAILEENTTLKSLNISRNKINDIGMTMISKALANNVSLKDLDIGWNSITSVGALKLADALKKNTELEIIMATMNGFAENGGKALVQMLRQNNVIKKVDISANRITDAVLKSLSYSLDQFEGLTFLSLADNPISTKAAIDFISGLMATTAPISHIDLTGVHVTEDFKGLCNALYVVNDITIVHSNPPAKREFTNDILTRNLVALCEFMEEEEIEVDDLYPDFEDWDDCDKIMITVKDALQALQCTEKVTQQDKLQKLKSKLRRGRNRKFLVKELALVYYNTICGKDSLREKPLRSHLRHSIREERAEKERQEKAKQTKRYSAPVAPSRSK